MGSDIIERVLPESNSGWSLKKSREAMDDRYADLKAVVVGGGTGAPVSIKTLLALGVETSAVVAMTDDGGSTGLIRERADAIPPGDIRKCITAMAADPDDPVVKAFKYRFDYAYNHTLGNLMITALADVASFVDAIDICERLLGSLGHVYPSTLDPIVLEGRTLDGRMLQGQSTIAHSDTALASVWLNPSDPEPYEPALQALREADLIVLGPGSLFTSIIPNLLVPGVREAIRESGAKTIFLCSVADMQGETWGLDCAEHVQALLDHGMEGLLHIACVNANPKKINATSSSKLAAIEALDALDTQQTREFEAVSLTHDVSGAQGAVGSRRSAIRRVPVDKEIVERIKHSVPAIMQRQLSDPVSPTWHSPRALGAVFEGVLEICRSQAR